MNLNLLGSKFKTMFLNITLWSENFQHAVMNVDIHKTTLWNQPPSLIAIHV